MTLEMNYDCRISGVLVFVRFLDFFLISSKSS